MEWTERLLKTLENKHYAKSIHFPWTRPEADQYFYLALSEQHSLSSTALKHLVSKKMNGWITVNPDIYHLFSLPDCTLQHQNTCFIIIFFDYTMVIFILTAFIIIFLCFYRACRWLLTFWPINYKFTTAAFGFNFFHCIMKIAKTVSCLKLVIHHSDVFIFCQYIVMWNYSKWDILNSLHSGAFKDPSMSQKG